MVLLSALALGGFVCFRFPVGLLESAVHCSDPVCNAQDKPDQKPSSPGAEVSVGPNADVAWQKNPQHYLQAEGSVGSESFPVILHLNRLGGGELAWRSTVGQR